MIHYEIDTAQFIADFFENASIEELEMVKVELKKLKVDKFKKFAFIYDHVEYLIKKRKDEYRRIAGL